MMNEQITFKISFNNEIRRFSSQPSFSSVCESINRLWSIEERVYLSYFDDDDDKIIVSTEHEFQEALNVQKAMSEKERTFERELLKVYRFEVLVQPCNNSIHLGVSCDGCGVSPIVGTRFKSSIRENFDLCENCERSSENSHPSHPMLKITRPDLAPREIFVTVDDDQTFPRGLPNGMPIPKHGRPWGPHYYPNGPHPHHHGPHGHHGPHHHGPHHHGPRGPHHHGPHGHNGPHPHGPHPHERRLRKWAKFNGLWGEEASVTASSIYTEATATAASPSKDAIDEVESDIVQGKPCARFVRDVSFPDGTPVLQGSIIQKTWKVRNDGNIDWPATTCIAAAGGDLLNFCDNQPVTSISPNQEIDITVQLTAPKINGRFLGYFRLRNSPVLPYFGHRFWIDIRVIDDEDERLWVNVPNTENASPAKCPFVEGRTIELDQQVEKLITAESATTVGIYNEELNLFKRELETLSDMGFRDFNVTLPLLKEHIAANKKPNDVEHAEGMQKVVANLLNRVSRHSS